MRFGVLGPLGVWTSNGTQVKVPEAKVRALLADLLIHEGRTVPAGRLIDDLWEDRLPANPSGALQAKVSQLRRALEEAEPGGRDLVVHQPPGYLLRLSDGALDASRFATLTARARGTRDVHRRAQVLADALGLWRGPALADFADNEFARAAAVRMDEQRLVALEDHVEARLELGEHRLIVGELGDLLAQHPLRERLRASHMRALYRSGRQTEALDSYNALRRKLLDDLGLDPSPEITELHRAILEQAPDLDAPPGPGATTTANAGPDDGRPTIAPPPTRRTNLPTSLTDLIGRTEAVADVRTLLESSRLVTLTGPGGVGKTRLALETAREHVFTFPDGVWLIELATLDDDPARSGMPPTPTDVAELVAATLEIRDDTAPSRPAAALPTALVDRIDGLTRAMRPQRMLLVLDNCEHVIEPVAELVGHLLERVPELRILTTSREGLGITGEVHYAVPPLGLPDASDGASLTELRNSSAVRLFEARAAQASPSFVVDDGNAAAVASICRQLDGLPLALELAATRVRVLDVHQLADRLDDRFRVLATGRRAGPARQQTLRAMIDWSWELLTAAERTVLRRLSVFADGCTLESAEEICSGGGISRDEVLDLLARLVERSLVVMTDSPAGSRYRLLESIAAYGMERLQEAGELEQLLGRHARHYVTIAEEAGTHLRDASQQDWLVRLDTDAANLRRSLDSATCDGDTGLALRLVNALAWYWLLRGRLGEACRALRAALSTGGRAPVADRADANTWLTALTMIAGDTRHPPDPSDAVLELYRHVDDPARQARAQWLLGYAEFGIGSLDSSEKLVARALPTFRAVDDRWGTAAALSTQAQQAIFRGDFVTVEQAGKESMELFRSLGDGWGELQATDALSMLLELAGDHEQYARLQRHGLRIAEELGLWNEVSHRMSGLGRAALLAGDYETADHFHQRARKHAADHSNVLGEEFAEIGLALSARRQGKLDDAETHLRNWLDWNREMEALYGLALILAELGFIAELRGDSATARSYHLQSLEAAHGTADPRGVALAFEGLAGASALAGDHEHAAFLLGAATAARVSVGAPLPPAERGDVDRITATITAALGHSAVHELTGSGGRRHHLELADELLQHRSP